MPHNATCFEQYGGDDDSIANVTSAPCTESTWRGCRLYYRDLCIATEQEAVNDGQSSCFEAWAVWSWPEPNPEDDTVECLWRFGCCGP
jgi:hypothetical protein